MNTEKTKQHRRWRTLVAGLALVFWIIVYALLVAWLVPSILATGIGRNILFQSVLFFLLGLLWIPPTIYVIRWGAKDPGNELSNRSVEERLR